MKVNYQNKMVRETPCFWKASMMAGELERSWKQRVLHAALETGQLKEVTGSGPVLPTVFPKLDGISQGCLGFTILQPNLPMLTPLLMSRGTLSTRCHCHTVGPQTSVVLEPTQQPCLLSR